MEEGNLNEAPTTLAALQESTNEPESVPPTINAENTDEETVEETDDVESSSKEGIPATESLTAAPTMDQTQFTTMSILSTTGTESSAKKHRRGISKIDAANEFVYGHVEESWSRPDRKLSTDLNTTFRPNRTQTMRQSCIMKRTQNEERERNGKDEARSPGSEPENIDPVTARPVPKSVYVDPKIRVKDTKSSKFRYLFNRKPPGVKVYFKPANADQKKKPPFVVSVVHI